jgi:hypothetical protein
MKVMRSKLYLTSSILLRTCHVRRKKRKRMLIAKRR